MEIDENNYLKDRTVCKAVARRMEEKTTKLCIWLCFGVND